MLAMLTDDRAFMAREWRTSFYIGGGGTIYDFASTMSDMANFISLIGAPVVTVWNRGFTSASVGRITSININPDARHRLSASMRVDPSQDCRPFREPFVPDTYTIVSDPDWYRIQADYWEDRADPFAGPCRKFGEYLSEMFTLPPLQSHPAAPLGNVSTPPPPSYQSTRTRRLR